MSNQQWAPGAWVVECIEKTGEPKAYQVETQQAWYQENRQTEGWYVVFIGSRKECNAKLAELTQ